MSNGTVPLAEFLAIVHALAHLNKEKNPIPIYSASSIALEWVHNKQIPGITESSATASEMLALADRALGWLQSHSYTNPLLKWNLSRWGEMPIAFDHALLTKGIVTKEIAKNIPCSSQTSETEQRAISPAADRLFQIVISGKTYPFKQKLVRAGLRWNGMNWSGSFPINQIETLKRFCQRGDLQYSITGHGLKESRLPRGSRPISYTNPVGVMGEGRLQWAIDETFHIESLRHRQKKRSKKS